MRKRHSRLASPLAAAILVSAATACSGGSSPGITSAPSVSCANYDIHGTGKYRDEVWVRVSVGNPTSATDDYMIDVDLTGSHPAGATPGTHVTITGLVPARSSAVLSRKVLTTGRVQRCHITRLARSLRGRGCLAAGLTVGVPVVPDDGHSTRLPLGN